MFAFIVRRCIQALVVMMVISCIGFAIKHMFGDPVRELAGVNISPQERENIRNELGLNDPFMVQWGRFLKGAVHGDLGMSYFYKKPATEIILGKAPATLELVIAASILIVLFSVPIGIYAAVKPNTWFSRTLMGASVVGVSIPVFLTAIVLISIFSVHLKWLPSFGRGQDLTPLFGGAWMSGFFTWDGLSHLILPSVSLASIMLPLFIRLIRAEMKEVLESEYVKFARAKGLGPNRVLYVHAFKNTLLPVITVGGVQLGVMIAYTMLTETVFQWQGMGFMFLEALQRADTSLMSAYLVFVGFIFVFVNTLVDIIYGLVNPMVRISSRI
ncbi:MAG: ABC transporter permease [Desulfobacteraceae bacterium]|nr:ABC transporter permease [Desulfobacteraceae bacterium]